MAKVTGRSTITATVTLELTEAEAGALDALVGYGFKPFIDVFYAKMGRAYLQPYEAGLASLFESVRGGTGSVSSFLERLRKTREVWNSPK